MTKVIATENAPAAIGPYVQAVDLGNMVMTSGQILLIRKPVQLPTMLKLRRVSH